MDVPWQATFPNAFHKYTLNCVLFAIFQSVKSVFVSSRGVVSLGGSLSVLLCVRSTWHFLQHSSYEFLIFGFLLLCGGVCEDCQLIKAIGPKNVVATCSKENSSLMVAEVCKMDG